MTLAAGARQEGASSTARGCRRAESLRREFADARLHARPARRRQGRAGRAPRVLRPRARPPAPRSRRRPAGLRRRARAAERRAAARPARPLRTGRRSRRGRSGSPRSGAQLVAARTRDARARSRPASPSARDELGLPGAHARATTAEPPTAAALEARLDARPRARRDRARPAPRRRPRRVSGDRDLRSFGSQGEQRLAVLSLLLAEAELLPRAAAAAARRRPLGARPRAGARCSPSASRASGRP